MSDARAARWGADLLRPLAGGCALALATLCAAALPPVPVPVPPENPLTEAKRILGKILFFDEQLSTTNFVACATCHTHTSAGTDPRPAHHPGPDRLLNTADDVRGSAGVVRSDSFNRFDFDPLFGLRPQVTARAANSPINSAYATELFWDGRALGAFVDPQSGQTVIPAGGSLESQAAMPPLDSVEMAHAANDWDAITEKLERVRALDFATALPPDIATELSTTRSYRELFRRAFGDSAITARRIAFSVATYERTLISDRTPWDAYQAGEPGALSPAQIQGLAVLTATGCTQCHTPPLFSDGSFRNLGHRPNAADAGRQSVTGDPADRGKFRVPSLRNAGLKDTFGHAGDFHTIEEVIAFYAAAPSRVPTPDNRDPALNNLQVPPEPARAQLAEFLRNGLTDPRVAAGEFPFDKPLLATERFADLPQNFGGGVGGVAGIPRIIVQSAPMIGNREFRVGLGNAPPGATVRLGISSQPPKSGRIAPDRFLSPTIVSGTTAATAAATVFWPLLPGQVTPGQNTYLQWFVEDSAAPGGQSLSQVVRLTYFCGSAGCPSACSMSDFNGDGVVDDTDFQFFLAPYDAAAVPMADALADLDADGFVGDTDFILFLNAYNQLICP